MVMSTRSNTKEVLRGELRWSSKGEVNSSLQFCCSRLEERLHLHVLVLFKGNVKKKYVEK